MPDDFTSGIDTTGRVAVGGTAAGELEAAHDRDWFAVELVAGRTYTIDLRGRPTDDGTLSDPYLRGIHDADGNLVPGTTNDDWGGTYNSRVTFTASETGTYYIAAGAFSNRQGTYELEVMDNSPPAPEPPATPLQPTTGQTVPEPAGADLAADPSTTGRVAVGETATGNIESAGDRDWFAVELVAGRTYTIDLRGRPTADGTLSDPYLRGIHDAQGNLLSGTTNDDWGGTYNSRVTFTATESGTHYIAAGAFSSRQGTYEVAVTDNSPSAPAPEPPATPLQQTTPQTGSEPAGADLAADPSTTGRVAVGETATGNIESAGDRDWFAVELVAGRTYTIDLRGRPTADGTLSDPYLRGIHDAQGNLLSGTTNDDWGGTYNSRGTFTATETGTYYIAAGAWSSRQGTYEVEVTDSSPEPVEETPSVRVSDAEATEGDDAEIVFHVTLDRAASGPVTVRYATADGTAVAGEDYEAASGTLTFAPGETERTVRVRVLDDAVEDSGETFRLVLSAPAGATLADPEALGTILNSEPVSEPPNGDLPAGLPHGPSTPGRVVVDGGPVTGDDRVRPRLRLGPGLVRGRARGRQALPDRSGGLQHPARPDLRDLSRSGRFALRGPHDPRSGDGHGRDNRRRGRRRLGVARGAGGRHLLHRRQRARGAPQPRRWRHSKQWSGQPRRLPPRGGGIARHGPGDHRDGRRDRPHQGTARRRFDAGPGAGGRFGRGRHNLIRRGPGLVCGQP